MSILKNVRIVLILAGVLVVATSPAFAQSASEPGATVGTIAVEGADPALSSGAAAPAWGTTDFTMFQIGAAAFIGRSSDATWDYKGNGYIFRTGSYNMFWAPVVLPAGALLGGFRFFYYDNSSSDISVYFTRYYDSTPPSTQDLVSWTSSGTPGYGSDFITVNKTITYRDASNNEQNFNILVRLLDPTTDMAFKGVRFLYYRQVSPAPATATFNDVPTGHWAFQFVEALAASGITAGCGGGNYCPDDTITRGQMAVFLASALGLHWTGNEAQ